jgi:hypothetical protein
LLHIHYFFFQPQYIIFFSKYFSFPFQYNSTTASYSIIHLPSTSYNSFLPIYQISPLSIIQQLQPTNLYFYNTKCIIFYSRHFSSPLSVSSQYCYTHISFSTTHLIIFCLQIIQIAPFSHCTIAEYTFVIQLPKMYNIFLQIFQFSPFYFILQLLNIPYISTTNSAYYFSPNISVLPFQYHSQLLQTH